MEIAELVEREDGWTGSTTGYFAKGTHDPQKFAGAINHEFGLPAVGNQAIEVDQVQFGYLRKVPDPCGGWLIHKSSKGKGAFEATFIFL